jgi:hypothetical protein
VNLPRNRHPRQNHLGGREAQPELHQNDEKSASILEPLWMGRVRDLQAGKTELTAADLTNRVTWERSHNDAPLEAILRSFRINRGTLIGELDTAEQSLLERSAKHPRLETPMRSSTSHSSWPSMTIIILPA